MGGTASVSLPYHEGENTGKGKVVGEEKGSGEEAISLNRGGGNIERGGNRFAESRTFPLENFKVRGLKAPASGQEGEGAGQFSPFRKGEKGGRTRREVKRELFLISSCRSIEERRSGLCSELLM